MEHALKNHLRDNLFSRSGADAEIEEFRREIDPAAFCCVADLFNKEWSSAPPDYAQSMQIREIVFCDLAVFLDFDWDREYMVLEICYAQNRVLKAARVIINRDAWAGSHMEEMSAPSTEYSTRNPLVRFDKETLSRRIDALVTG